MGCKKMLSEAAGENISMKSEGLSHAVCNTSKNSSKDANEKKNSTKHIFEIQESKITNLEEDFKKKVSLHDNNDQDDFIKSFSVLTLNTHATEKLVDGYEVSYLGNSCKVEDDKFQERGPCKSKSNRRYFPFQCGFQNKNEINYKILHWCGGSSFVEKPIDVNFAATNDAINSNSSLGLSVECMREFSVLEHCDQRSIPLSPESGYGSSPHSENSFSHNELNDLPSDLETESKNNIEEIFEQFVSQRPNIPPEELEICLNDANELINTELEQSKNCHDLSKQSLCEENTNELQPFEYSNSHDLLEPLILEKNLNGHEFHQPIIFHCTNSLDFWKPITLENSFKATETCKPLSLEHSNKLKKTVITPVQLRPAQNTNRYRPILPKPRPCDEIFNESSLLKGEANKPAKKVLLEKLNPDIKERYARQIYKYLYENNEKSAIFIENKENRRTNLHTAILNKEIENAFCIVEIHQQMQDIGKESQDVINLSDIENKTALDYAVRDSMIFLALYLIEAGARCSSDAINDGT